MNPKSCLAGVLEAGVIAFAFGTKGVGAFEGGAGSVDGETVVVRDSDVFGTAAVLSAVVPVPVIAGALAGLGLAEGAAELLSCTTSVRGLAILAHGEAGFTNEVANGQLGRILGVSLVERDDGFALVDIADSVVYGLDVIALIGDEGAFLDRDDLVGGLEDIEGDGGIGDIGGRGDLVDRQTGDTIHEDVVLVAPEELAVLLVVLVGSGMNAQGAVRIVAGLVFGVKLGFAEGLGIVLRGACGDRRGIQSDEGGVQNPQLVEFPNLIGHDLLQFAVFQLAQEAVKGPVGRQRPRDVEAAVVGDEEIALEEVPKVCNLVETLALHNDERAEHGFLGKALAPG